MARQVITALFLFLVSWLQSVPPHGHATFPFIHPFDKTFGVVSNYCIFKL